jgi:hypothetical protein
VAYYANDATVYKGNGERLSMSIELISKPSFESDCYKIKVITREKVVV